MLLVQCPECSSEISSESLKCVRCGFLISNSNAMDVHGQTALMIAFATGDQEIIDLLHPSGTPQTPNVLRNPKANVPSKITAKRRIIKLIDEDQVPERHESQVNLSCLECGGDITPDEMNCSHCKTLIMRRYCSHCSKLIPDHAKVCPLCNKNVEEHFSYGKLRRAKILIGAGTAAIFVLILFILLWQHSDPKTTTVEADAMRKPEIDLSDAKPAKPEKQQVTLPETPVAQEAVPLPAIETKKPNKAFHAEDPVESRVETPQLKTPELAKLQSEPEFTKPEEPPSKLAKLNEVRQNAVLSAATVRTLELQSQQRIKKGKFLNNKGYNLIKSGRPSDAIPVLEQSVRSFPPEGKHDRSYAYALFNLAVAYRRSGRPDIAIPILKERIKINDQRDVVERELLAATREARLSRMAERHFN